MEMKQELAIRMTQFRLAHRRVQAAQPPASVAPPGNLCGALSMSIRRVAQVVSAVACWFSNERNADDPRALTHFHSIVPPGVSLADYATVINRAVAFGDDGMEIALILIGRACQPHIEPALNLSALSMHRLLLTALRVATKAHHDVFRSNKTFARAGGVSLAELNMLEAMFLDRIEFNVQVTAEEVARLRTGLHVAEASCGVSRVTMVKHLSLALNLYPISDSLPATTARMTSADDDMVALSSLLDTSLIPAPTAPVGGARVAARALHGRISDVDSGHQLLRTSTPEIVRVLRLDVPSLSASGYAVASSASASLSHLTSLAEDSSPTAVSK